MFAQDGAATIRAHTRTGRQSDAMNFWAESFNQDNAGEINVVIEHFPGSEYFQKINTLTAGGTIGEVFWISSTEGYFRLAATGVSRPVDDLIAESGYELSEHYEPTISAARLNGELYGIPILAHPGRNGIFFNKTLFDDAGVDYPDYTWTYEDLLAAALELADPDQNIWGFMDPLGSYFEAMVIIRAWGGDTLNEDGTESLFDSDEAIAALKFMSALYNEHKVSPPPGTMAESHNQLFAANKLAMFGTGFWGSGVTHFLDDPSIMGVAPGHIGPSGRRGSFAAFDMLCVSGSTEHPKEAFKWVDYNTSFDAQLRATLMNNVTSSRPAVMGVDEIQENETLQVFAHMMEDAMPLILPANFRDTEHFKFVGDQLQAIWLGLATVDEVIQDVNDGAQAILDKSALG